MSSVNGITSIHTKKLEHTIEEIRVRALDNVISKLDLGFGCGCNTVKRELIVKLFKWFTFENILCPDKALGLLLRLVKEDRDTYLNAFGKLRFQNELHELRRKLGSEWYDKINEIEAVVLDTHIKEVESRTLHPRVPQKRYNQNTQPWNSTYGNENLAKDTTNSSQDCYVCPSAVDSTVPFELTLPSGDGIPIIKATKGGIKWLLMPWQPLVASDKGVLTAVEEALNNTVDTKLILHTCQFITNVMLQDFPAEVFLQRPAIILVLHSLLESNTHAQEANQKHVTCTVLKTLYKLTRSLRFRIYYYCDPCIANKKQKLLSTKIDSITYSSSEARDSPDGGVPEANYQAYQSTGTSDRTQSVMDNIEESVLQLQQMLIPTYCIESLKYVLMQLSTPVDPTFPLKHIRYVMDLAYELVQLLNTSIMPNIWLCTDGTASKITEDLKTLFKLLGELMEYFCCYNSVDFHRITYLHLICITIKLLSNVVPLELSNTVLPNSLKMSICSALMDAPIYLMYQGLHSTLHKYTCHFQGEKESAQVNLYDETRIIAKSMQAAVALLKHSSDQTPSEILKTIYAAKMSLSYHKYLCLIKKAIGFLQNVNRYNLSNEENATATKLVLSLLANGDLDIQYAAYVEIHKAVKAILGVEFNRDRLSYENLIFLLQPSIFTEIICHGVMHEDVRIKELAEDILIYILKGRRQLGEPGWEKTLEALVPVLSLLQCHAHPSTPLGQCVTKMLDPDIYVSIQLPYLEVVKGNLRLLYSPNSDIREEALCRLIFLLGQEKDSTQKLPKLSSLHGLPLSSLCIFERKTFFKQSQGNYQRSNLLSILEMLNEPNVDPKMRKSALVQISVMLSDVTLHKLFISENGLPLIMKIFNSSLIENDYINYLDSVIPILTILKLLASTESSVRQELYNNVDVYLNIIRSLFLYPNNECAKIDGSQLLCILLYSVHIMRCSDTNIESYDHLNISLPYIIVTKMRLPFVCKSHWKTSMHRRSDVSVLHSTNQAALSFVRQYWAWEWNGGLSMLWKNHNELNDPEISQKLMIQECEFFSLQYSFPHFYCQQQLYNIQNSITHDSVSCALDYLIMYIKLYKLLWNEGMKDIKSLPWEHTFERFLISHPASKEDCDLFVDVINFLQLFINVTKNGKNEWIIKIMKNTTKSLIDLFQNSEMDNQDIHQSILKLARTCSAVEKTENYCNDSKTTWTRFIELVVSSLCFGDQQHFYNLAYLDWLLTCLTYLIGQCEWGNCKNLLVSLGNTLIELIISFHGAGTVSFMGLSITRNSIICLCHLLHHMQTNLNKKAWTTFWYEGGRTLSWLPVLWQNRDPLVRASALQLLAGLLNASHTASQLLHAIVLAPSEMCHTLIHYITNRKESSVVREQACIAFSNLIKNCNAVSFQYVDSLQPHTILICVEQNNTYYEISTLLSNIYLFSTLDYNPFESQETITSKTTAESESDCVSLIPRTILYLYNCQEELQALSIRGSEFTDNDQYLQFIATPSLITTVCTLLNTLILIGQQEIVRQIYEHSIDQYLIRCFSKIPESIERKRNLTHYCDILEMYISICTILTNCIVHSHEFTAVATFSPDSLYILLSFLNTKLYHDTRPQMTYLRNRLWTEIYNFITILSLTDGQHFESLQIALDLCGPDKVLLSICIAAKESASELRMSCISCLTFLLCQEIQKDTLGTTNISFQSILDTVTVPTADYTQNGYLREVISDVNKISLRSISAHSRKSNADTEEEEEEEAIRNFNDNIPKPQTIGAELCGILLHLFIAHNYTRSKKSRKQCEDNDLIVGALANILCVSKEAKKLALEENFPETTITILKEIYVKLNLQPFDLYKNQPERENKQIHPLLHDINGVFTLVMNFMYGSATIKDVFSKEGLADILHKLWIWIALNKIVSTSALKLVATFTTKCPKAAQSLTLTTTLPGTGPRKTPNTVALIHVVIQLICKEIEKAGKMFDNKKLHFAFNILRNVVHVHECRISISKSNLLQFFTKIHPITTKRVKPWPLVEMYCLEFLIDFTYYEEGQISVPKASEAVDVLIQLAKCQTSSIRILAISILRNLSFNITNRPRFLSSVDFLNLLHDIFTTGSLCDIKIAGSMLWSLICNNQKGKLIARSARFPQSIQEALGRLTLLTMGDINQAQDLVQMLLYILSILSPVETKGSPL